MVDGLKILYVVTSLEPPDGRDGASFAHYLQPVPHTQALNPYLREELTSVVPDVYTVLRTFHSVFSWIAAAPLHLITPLKVVRVIMRQ